MVNDIEAAQEFNFPGYFWVHTEDYSMLANDDGEVVSVVYDFNDIFQD